MKKIKINKKMLLCVFACLTLVLSISILKPKKASAEENDYIEINQSYHGKSLSEVKELSNDLPVLFRSGDCIRVKVDSLEDKGMFDVFCINDFCYLSYDSILTEVCSCDLAYSYSNHFTFYESVSSDNPGSMFPTYSTYVYIVFNVDSLVLIYSNSDLFTIIPHENHLTDYEKGFNDGNDVGYEDGYSSGYDKGHEDGYFQGNDDGFTDGYNTGFTDGEESVDITIDNKEQYDLGYSKGVRDGEKVNANFGEMILGILDAPRQAISNMLNFEFLGVNLSSLVFFLISSALVVAIIKFFI